MAVKCLLQAFHPFVFLLGPESTSPYTPVPPTYRFPSFRPMLSFTLFSFFVSIRYSFYASGHRSVAKESKRSHGKYIHMYIWYSWWISIGYKYHTATPALPETSNRYTRTSFSSAFLFTPLHLLVCSMLHISSYFLYHFVCLYIHIQLFLLENYLLASVYSVAIRRNKYMLP